MSKRKKTDNIHTGGGAHVDGNVNVDGHGTFVGRDQKSIPHRKIKLEVVASIVVALITIVGTIVVALINSSTEIDKARLQIQMTQTAQAITSTATFTPTPQITETATSLPSP
jgi:hypothetical protein